MSRLRLIVLFVAAVFLGALSARADEFDTLRLKWRDMLTMGANANPADSSYFEWISSIESVAQNYWSSMKTNSTRTCLWSDLNQLGTRSADITGTYERLRAMAMGYAVHGSVLEGNSGLRGAIISGLDWMDANYYNETKTEYDNWFDWEIGVPLNLNDITVLLYDNLTGAQIANYMDAVNYFTPTPDLTGANEVWKASVVAVRGAIVKSSSRLVSARQALSDVFPYVTSGDGFYADGSFVFHSFFPYNGGYGAQLIETLGPLMQWLKGSSWEVTDPMQANLFRWIHDSFEPFIYKGAMMQMVAGRYYTRRDDDHLDGHNVMGSILRLAQFAPPTDAVAYRRLIKYWLQTDTYRNFVETQTPPFNVWAQEVLSDPNVAPSGELVRHYQFPRMDRVVHLRPGWGFGLAMSSSRTGNFESIRGENVRGWYTGDGIAYLYNSDFAQFADKFWPTVNPYRLPGTTVDNQTRTNASGANYLSPNNWVGGASIQNLYGVSGMQLNAWNSTLAAKKTWFMLDDEVVCLGAGITSTDNRTVETIVENRRLAGYGNNALTVNGAAKPASVGWSEIMTNTSWVHLAGNVPGADIGYFFLQPSTVEALRETRSGSLYDLNTAYGSTNLSTRNFLTLWFDHGVSPSNATYAYVLLPNQTAAQVASYASNPQIAVLENSTRAQGVKEMTLGITAVNFWRDGTNRLGVITVDRKSSVILRNDGTFLELGVSDPTQTNSSVINIEINVPASGALSADAGVSIVQLSPTIKLVVNVNGAGGQASHARFFVGPVQTVALSPAADAYVQNGDQANTNFGASQTLAVKAAATSLGRETYLRFELPPAPGMIFNATLRLVPITVNDLGLNHALAFVSDNSWAETSITWNSKPSSGSEFTRWPLPSAGTPVEIAVTSLAQQSAAADGKLSFRVYSTGMPPPTNGYAAYASKENGAVASRPQLILNLGRVPPTVVLNSPANGSLFDAPATLSLAADAQAPGSSATAVDFYSGSTKLAELSASPYTFTLTNLAAGKYTFTAIATDIGGLMSTSGPVTISVYNPQPPGRGTGLIGDYYMNQNLTGLTLTRTDPTVNFDWGFAAPAPSFPADRFSVRWTGKLQARQAGVHLFHTVSDEAVRLWVNGQLLIDHWTAHSATEDTGAISLVPGQYYDIALEYFDYVGTAVAQLYWTQPGGTKEIIPQTQLYPAASGLRGAYFSGTNFARSVFTRIDGAVNFSWGDSSPDPALLPGSFSVRWTGKVWANQSGPHAFYTRSDDGVRLWVNNQIVISNWTVHTATENSGTINLVAGQYYDLTLEYFDNANAATAVLMWAPPGESKQVIPEGNLTPNQNNEPPALATIPNLLVTPGHSLTFSVTAADADTPAQLLTFSLDPGAPAGASINRTNGLFTWAPAPTQPLGSYSVTVRVTDNGAPVMTDAQTVNINLGADFTSQPALTISRSGSNVVLGWPVEAGSFQLYTTANLSPSSTWTHVSSTPAVSNGQCVVSLPASTNPAGFFRLQTQ
jgi:hyaluronate lyase